MTPAEREYAFDVEASRYWNDTGVDVRVGEVLRIEASGRWADAQYACGPEGYRPPIWLRFPALLRRCLAAPLFCLAGAVGRRSPDVFPVGASNAVVMPASGRLYLFANDVPGFYFNNSGRLSVLVRCERSVDVSVLRAETG